MSYKKVSVIIPAYNEERTIAVLLNKVISAPLPEGLDKEIIVVNDGSKDNTLGVLNAVGDHPQVKIFSQTNAGKASAVMHGISKSSGGIILIQDADLEYDPNQYPKLLAPIIEGKADIVYGSRFLGNIKGMKLINRVANLISNWTLQLLWGVHLTDINTCYKIFPRKCLDGINITSSHFALETELTTKFIKKGLTIIEVPIIYNARSREEGKKIRIGTALSMYWLIWKYRFVS